MSTLKLIRTLRAELEKQTPPIKVTETLNVKGHIHLCVVREGVEQRLAMGGTPKCAEHEVTRTVQRILRNYRNKATS